MIEETKSLNELARILAIAILEMPADIVNLQENQAEENEQNANIRDLQPVNNQTRI